MAGVWLSDVLNPNTSGYGEQWHHLLGKCSNVQTAQPSKEKTKTIQRTPPTQTAHPSKQKAKRVEPREATHWGSGVPKEEATCWGVWGPTLSSLNSFLSKTSKAASACSTNGSACARSRRPQREAQRRRPGGTRISRGKTRRGGGGKGEGGGDRFFHRLGELPHRLGRCLVSGGRSMGWTGHRSLQFECRSTTTVDLPSFWAWGYFSSKSLETFPVLKKVPHGRSLDLPNGRSTGASPERAKLCRLL